MHWFHGVEKVATVQNIPRNHTKNGPLWVYYGSDFDLNVFFSSANVNLYNIKTSGCTAVCTWCRKSNESAKIPHKAQSK